MGEESKMEQAPSFELAEAQLWLKLGSAELQGAGPLFCFACALEK